MKVQLLKQVYEQFGAYSSWLSQQDLSQHDMRACVSRVNHFLVFIGTEYGGDENIVADPFRRDDAFRQYRQHLRKNLKASPSSANASMRTLDHFFQFIGLAPSAAALEEEVFEFKPMSDLEHERFKEGIRRSLSSRDRAIATVMLESGLLATECSALNMEDIFLSRASGFARVVRDGSWQELPFNPITCLTLNDWLNDRAKRWQPRPDLALFLGEQGLRLTAAAVDLTVRRIGASMGLQTPARVLYKSYLLNEARRANDFLTACELLASPRAVSTSG